MDQSAKQAREYQIMDNVKIRLTQDEGMIVGIIDNGQKVFVVRLKNYSEITFRSFELELIK